MTRTQDPGDTEKQHVVCNALSTNSLNLDSEKIACCMQHAQSTTYARLPAWCMQCTQHAQPLPILGKVAYCTQHGHSMLHTARSGHGVFNVLNMHIFCFFCSFTFLFAQDLPVQSQGSF